LEIDDFERDLVKLDLESLAELVRCVLAHRTKGLPRPSADRQRELSLR
jgi:hypothetical protein